MLNDDYIVGLVDGEGSFTVYIRDPDKPSKVKRRVKIEPRFYLKLIERDKSILDELKKYFKCGNVYFQKDSRQNHQDCYRFEVTNRSDLEKVIIPFFRKHELRFSSKRKDFKVFCELMRRIKKEEHLDPDGLRNLCRIKQQMH